MTIRFAGPLLAAVGALACAGQLTAQGGPPSDAEAGSIWAQVPSDARGFDRAAAARRIANRLKASEDYAAELYSLKRQQALSGKDMTAKIKALGNAPSLQELKEDALRVIKLDPSDEAAAQAIRVIAISYFTPVEEVDGKTQVMRDSPEGRLHIYMWTLIQRYHVNRPDIPFMIQGVENATDFWGPVYSTTTNPQVRGNAAAALMDYTFNRLNDGTLSEQERRRLHEQGMAYAKEITEKYADVTANRMLSLPSYLEKGKATLGEFVASRDSILSHSVGDTLPNIKVAKADGTPDELDNYRGKVVVLDFWATWCGFCIAQHPSLEALQKEMAGKPLEIIGVSVDDTLHILQKYLKTKPEMSWTQWYVGRHSPLVKEWGVMGYPTYFIIDTDGRVRERTNHLDEKSKALVREMVSKVKTPRTNAS